MRGKDGALQAPREGVQGARVSRSLICFVAGGASHERVLDVVDRGGGVGRGGTAYRDFLSASGRHRACFWWRSRVVRCQRAGAMADCRCFGHHRHRDATAMEARPGSPNAGAAGARHRADGAGPKLGPGWYGAGRLPRQHVGRGACRDRCSAGQDHVHRSDARLGVDPLRSPPRRPAAWRRQF